jgi:carbonic anhydrase/acetyltransferase-like protein (isoleucine patch superfamily)
LLSNPNILRLARCTRSADVDVVAAGREVDPCIGSQSDIRRASCVVGERFETFRTVVVTSGVVFQCKTTIRCVVGAGSVAKERFKTVSRVVVAGGALKERRTTSGRVGVAASVGNKRASAFARSESRE